MALFSFLHILLKPEETFWRTGIILNKRVTVNCHQRNDTKWLLSSSFNMSVRQNDTQGYVLLIFLVQNETRVTNPYVSRYAPCK